MAITLFLFSTVITIAQTEEWSLPFSITDSLTDNHNPHIAIYEEGNYSTGGIVFWERIVNDSTTAIWMRNLTWMSPEEEVFYQEGVHFRNVKFFPYYDYDTLFAIIYEANITGDYDIYMSKYSEDGNISDPEYILGDDGDDINPDVKDYEFVCWQVDGAIKLSEFLWSHFAAPVTVDSLNCLNPSFGASTIAYEKIINDSSRIYYSMYDHSQGWSEATEFFNTGHNTSIEFVAANHPSLSYNTFFWENYNGLEWRIYGVDLDDPEILDTEIVSDEPLFPDPLYFDIPIAMPQYVFISYLTFSKEENGTREVFANDAWGHFLEGRNISVHDSIDIRPYLEVGGSDWNVYIYDIWERYTNGHCQLMASKLSVRVDIDENLITDTDRDLQLYPNPVTDQLTIEFPEPVKSEIQVNVYNTSGMHVCSIHDSNTGHIYWDRNNRQGIRVPKGIYLFEIITENRKSFEKVIVAD